VTDRLPFIVLLPVLALDIAAIADLLIRRDISLGRKLLWALVILLMPALGATIYLLARFKIFSTVRRSL
jgi:hypothetical protein